MPMSERVVPFKCAHCGTQFGELEGRTCGKCGALVCLWCSGACPEGERGRSIQEPGISVSADRLASVLWSMYTLLVAFAAGVAIWALAPLVGGAVEPWDSEWPYYSLALLTGGFAMGILGLRPLWLMYLGVVSGQLAYGLFFLPLGPLFAVGIGLLCVYSLLTLLAAIGGERVRRRLSRKAEGKAA